jgi:hypothetical protein
VRKQTNRKNPTLSLNPSLKGKAKHKTQKQDPQCMLILTEVFSGIVKIRKLNLWSSILL